MNVVMFQDNDIHFAIESGSKYYLYHITTVLKQRCSFIPMPFTTAEKWLLLLSEKV